MLKGFILVTFILLSANLFALPIQYAEHYYELYHLNLYRYPESYLENLYYLELALQAPFANPLNAIARVENERENKYYQALFRMHVNLKMTENCRYLGAKYDKQTAYWFNAPFKTWCLKGLNQADEIYNLALYYWNEAKRWSNEASKYSFLTLDEIQFWMDESWRIQNNELNHEKYIKKDLDRVHKNIAIFESMDETTFPLKNDQFPLNRFFKRRTIYEIRRDNNEIPMPPRVGRKEWEEKQAENLAKNSNTVE